MVGQINDNTVPSRTVGVAVARIVAPTACWDNARKLAFFINCFIYVPQPLAVIGACIEII